MPPISRKKNILISWKEISSYLGSSIRTTRRWEKERTLPVQRFSDSEKSRVYAYKEDIDEWLKTEFRNNKSEITNMNQPSKKRKALIWIFPILLIVSFGVYYLNKGFSENLKPSDFKIIGSELIIINENGQELWKYDTGIFNLLDEKTYRDHFQHKKFRENSSVRNFPYIMIRDIDNDNQGEILFSIQTQTEYGEGDLLCFDYKGNLKWTFKAGRELTYGRKTYSPDYRIFGFDTFDLDMDGKLEIVVISAQLPYFPTQLVILSTGGTLIGEYWNSGRLIDFTCLDLNLNGRIEIVVVGMNNEYRKGCLIVLDPLHLKGGSPQKNDFYKSDSLDAGSEIYYILFPRTDVDKLKYHVECVSQINVLQNQRLSSLLKRSNIYYEFDYNLRILDVRTSHMFEQLHKEARKKNEINSEINEEYLNKLARDLLYYDGKDWVSQPTKTSYWKYKEKSSSN